ncbi:hypothetical protein [Streptomyces erythrochromogenes]|uniref:hypothetical protein n=1 Tax=Streptomyces erythrochromogenes TaxID=285574 RepID=UPI00225C3B60|nr:hypothetical protein [Streptomyces erythrochromogenes]MCX5585594.1 hypothetical protein [Streptomyces erythrochromogenes]
MTSARTGWRRACATSSRAPGAPPYYRELPDVSADGDLTRLPVLEKAAPEAHSLPASRDLSSGDPATGEVLRSGATGGEPRHIVYSRTDWENMVREAVPMLYALGLEPGDRIVNTLFGGGMHGGLTATFTSCPGCPWSRTRPRSS